jgi:hypothetical protein
MKKLVMVATALAVLSILVPAAYAAPSAAGRATQAGPYEGVFEGFVWGDKGSKAPIGLELTHRGREVEGTVVLGDGLYVSGGWCGAVQVPATEQYVSGQTDRGNARRVAVTPTFDAGGFDLTVKFESTLSTDGKTITARAKIDLPWFCGRDPVLTGSLYRG